MTRATQAKYYPQQFFEIADAISRNPRRIIELEFPDKQQARTFRLEFYSFRRCAEREGLTDTYPELCAVTILMDRETGCKVQVMHKDNTPTAQVVAKALKGV